MSGERYRQLLGYAKAEGIPCPIISLPSTSGRWFVTRGESLDSGSIKKRILRAPPPLESRWAISSKIALAVFCLNYLPWISPWPFPLERSSEYAFGPAW